jgi:hypothetical protein
MENSVNSLSQEDNEMVMEKEEDIKNVLSVVTLR